MKKKKKKNGVLGVFAHMDSLNAAIKYLKAAGRDDLSVYAPCPRHEISDTLAEKKSNVRFLTAIGGTLGVTIGYLFPSFVSLDWILPTSGKEIVALPAFTIPAFELTVLFGSICTIAAIILLGRLVRDDGALYDERFSDDKFGIFVPCETSEYDKFEKALFENGAEEVTRAE
ncbi:MAG: hypothetical protein CR997_06905 [Acidobacteria bacterium]|nr:MAG: hypothetical protein CR997_06905 [Acidobacteriota bacterium]